MKRQLTIMLSKSNPKIDVFFASHETRFVLSAAKKNFPSLILRLSNLTGSEVHDMLFQPVDINREFNFDREKFAFLHIRMEDALHDLHHKFAITIW